MERIMSSEEKIFFTYNDIHNTIQSLSKMIQQDGYDPDVIVKLNDVFAYFTLAFERILIPRRIDRDIFIHLDAPLYRFP